MQAGQPDPGSQQSAGLQPMLRTHLDFLVQGFPSSPRPCLLSQHIMVVTSAVSIVCYLKMWYSNPSIVEILEREINNLRHMVYSSSKALREKRQKAEVEKGRMF